MGNRHAYSLQDLRSEEERKFLYYSCVFVCFVDCFYLTTSLPFCKDSEYENIFESSIFS